MVIPTAILLTVLTPGTAVAARIRCAENGSTDIYVNPVVQRPRNLTPTGISSPPECAFATITQAINSAEDRGLGAGARIILTGGTAAAPAVFAQEAFPLAFPPGITVTTTADPAVGGSGLDPKAYIVRFTGRAAYAAHTEGGRLAGFTLKNERATRATIMLICDAGSTTIESLTLNGTSGAGGVIGRGLHLWPGCDLDASTLRVRGAGNGVVVEEGADLALAASKIHNNSGDGLTLRGTVSFGSGASTVIAFNGDDGVLVERSTSAQFFNLEVYENGGNGFEVHPSDSTFGANLIYNNSRGTGWNQPQMLFDGPPTAGGVPVETSSGTVAGYLVGGGEECSGSVRNSIFGFNISDASAVTVGLRAVNGAVVDASGNEWATSTPGQNVTVDALSFVRVAFTCGTRGDPGFPSPPIEE